MQRYTVTPLRYFLIPLLACTFLAMPLKAQINCDTSFTAEQLVDSFLLGQGIRAGNITFTGQKVGIAYFRNETNAVGIENGILLSTGSVFNANGPNNTPYITTNFMDPNVKKRPKGDRDLNKICRSVTYDVSILEFDFIPFDNLISFSYVFGSEEYLSLIHISEPTRPY